MSFWLDFTILETINTPRVVRGISSLVVSAPGGVGERGHWEASV